MAYDGVLFKTTDPRWGAGKGSVLTATEIDENMFELLERIQQLESNPPVPAGISNITVTAGKMTIHLSNGDSYGPFTLPVATFRDRGAWAPATEFLYNDIFSVPQVGVFRVLKDHISAATFNQYAQDGGDFVYYRIFGEDTYRYEIGFFFPGFPGNGIPTGRAMAAHLVVEDMYLPAGLNGSSAKLIVAPASDLSFPLYQDTTEIGSIDFEAGADTATFTLANDVQFLGADKKRLRVIRPDDLDVDAEELIMTLYGIRGVA